MSWEITTVEPDASQVTISDGSVAETLDFLGTIDDVGLRILGQFHCDNRNSEEALAAQQAELDAISAV
ncbi:hypothetical protein V5E97_06745 [Singulisphaera sp. Ch08]|uniref:Uncharacterized protein n=1 Tax=Singulisphaera sp. Ch08 TaxID=3120278 RepID=A0AAU7CM30_9BACT